MTTPKEVAAYIVQTIKEETGDTLDVTIISSIVSEVMYETFSEMLSEEDMDIIESHDDNEFFWNYCAQKIPNYYTIVEETTADIITNYLVPENE